jgi:hypothetical protein
MARRCRRPASSRWLRAWCASQAAAGTARLRASPVAASHAPVAVRGGLAPNHLLPPHPLTAVALHAPQRTPHGPSRRGAVRPSRAAPCRVAPPGHQFVVRADVPWAATDAACAERITVPTSCTAGANPRYFLILIG